MKTDTYNTGTTYRFWLALITLLVLLFVQAAITKGSNIQTQIINEFNQGEMLAEPGSENDPYKIKKFRVTGPVNVEVSTMGGHINVKRGASNEVEVRLYVRTGYSIIGGSDFNPRDYNIVIEQTGNTI